MKVKIEKTWHKELDHIFNKDFFLKLSEKVKQEYRTQIIYPKGNNIFSSFELCPFDKVKVVIIGQDPYHGKNQANGLCFSVNNKTALPPSLKNIYKELEESIDSFEKPNHGDLSRWVKKENIILLNAALTVVEGKSNSHKKIWCEFTDNLIKYISDKCENVVFLLWGNFAKSKALLIDFKKHKIISSVHPSPLSSRYNCKGMDMSFFGHNQFNKVNEYLKKNDKKSISWDV